MKQTQNLRNFRILTSYLFLQFEGQKLILHQSEENKKGRKLSLVTFRHKKIENRLRFVHARAPGVSQTPRRGRFSGIFLNLTSKFEGQNEISQES